MRNWTKYILAFLSILVFRLIPFRAPNVEPIMSAIMPIGKTYGPVMSLFFAAFSILLYDMITSGIGIWTFFTAMTYGIIGLCSYYYFKKRSGWKHYGAYAAAATIAFDAITGLIPGPVFFGQPFMGALIGQIPFTLMHLVSNVSFAILLSPVLEKWFVKQHERSFAFHLTSRIQ